MTSVSPYVLKQVIKLEIGVVAIQATFNTLAMVYLCKYVDEPYVAKTRYYPLVKTASSCVHSFWHSAGVWWTDGQTGRQTDKRTYKNAIANTALSIAAARYKNKFIVSWFAIQLAEWLNYGYNGWSLTHQACDMNENKAIANCRKYYENCTRTHHSQRQN